MRADRVSPFDRARGYAGKSRHRRAQAARAIDHAYCQDFFRHLEQNLAMPPGPRGWHSELIMRELDRAARKGWGHWLPSEKLVEVVA